MSSTNELRARSWDGFHKQITQVVHVRGGGAAAAAAAAAITDLD